MKPRYARFASDERGSINILLAFSLIPMVGLIGLGIDFGVGQVEKNKLDNAADSAAVAAVATAKAYVAANPNDSNLATNAVNAGLARASRAFVINTGSLPFAAVPSVTTISGTVPTPATCASGTTCIYLAKTNQTFNASVVYSTTSANHFGQILGKPTIAITGSTAAAADIPAYLDFYLMIDVSGSMGLPATSAGQTALINYNGCQFACHFPGQNDGFNYAMNNNIQLRSGAVNSAVCGLMSKVTQQSVPNQYRVGIYPFITQMATLAALTTNISSVTSTAGCNQSPQVTFTNLLDTGATQLNGSNDPTTGVGSGGTHFDNAFTKMSSTVTTFGDGSSSSKSKPFIFLVTDGMQNGQYKWSQQNYANGYPGAPSQYNGWNDSYWTGSSPGAMDPSQCTSLKNSGATISVLYIPYSTLTVGNSNQGETNAANSAIPNIPTALSSCATSSNYFYTANTPADITNALASMFNQAVQIAHLTQ